MEPSDEQGEEHEAQAERACGQEEAVPAEIHDHLESQEGSVSGQETITGSAKASSGAAMTAPALHHQDVTGGTCTAGSGENTRWDPVGCLRRACRFLLRWGRTCSHRRSRDSPRNPGPHRSRCPVGRYSVRRRSRPWRLHCMSSSAPRRTAVGHRGRRRTGPTSVDWNRSSQTYPCREGGMLRPFLRGGAQGEGLRARGAQGPAHESTDLNVGCAWSASSRSPCEL